MLQTDVSANDGKIYGWNISLRRRSHMHDSLAVVLQAWQAGKLPEVAGVTPVIVAFHDVNPYTATHMTEYLQILVEEAKKRRPAAGCHPVLYRYRAITQRHTGPR